MNNPLKPDKTPLSDCEQWFNVCTALAEDALTDPDPIDIDDIDVAAVRTRILKNVAARVPRARATS
jgi:hypothetical protein